MNVLLFKRLCSLALVLFILPFSNVSFAETNSKNYDTKQLIRDVAVLYRKHKLAEAAQTAKPLKSNSQLAEVAKFNKKSQKHKASKLAKAKKRKARKLARAKRLLKSREKARLAKIAKATKKPFSEKNKRKMTVTATAYTSHVNQTDSTPNIAAWGDRLKPGMKIIAVSRDMLDVYGLKHLTKVRIKGLEGEYLVMDKMNKRWKKKIDIYMGMDLKKAYKWGRKKVELQWN